MKQFKVGLQLYSVRDKMEQDMETTLRRVKEIGYDYVEFAGYFGKSAEEVRTWLDKVGLTCLSVHQGYEVFLQEPEKNVAYLKTLGAKFCAIPWMSAERHAGTEKFGQTVADITKVAKLLRENGIQMLYHNHDFEFKKYEGKYLLDRLFDAVPDRLLKPEFDTCWVHYAGEDPCAYLRKYAGQIDVVHLKDFTCRRLGGGPAYALIDNAGKAGKEPTKEENGFRFMPLGSGMQNFPEILGAAEDAGAELVIVEQDNWYDSDSLEVARGSRDYLRSLGL